MSSPFPRRTTSHRSSLTRRSRRAALLLPALALSLTGLVACGGGDTETPRAATGECAYPATSGRPAARDVETPSVDPEEDAPTSVTIVTDQGEVPVSLEPDAAPCTVNSFLSLAEKGYFDDTPCHRLTTGGLSVLQCGDPSGTGTGGPGYSFADELTDDDARLQPCLDQVDPSSGREACTYSAGTLAMANSGPDTNGSQFFLVYEDSVLGNAYTVFGRMSAAGLDVVRQVAAGGVAPDGVAPATPVTITDVVLG